LGERKLFTVHVAHGLGRMNERCHGSPTPLGIRHALGVAKAQGCDADPLVEAIKVNVVFGPEGNAALSTLGHGLVRFLATMEGAHAGPGLATAAAGHALGKLDFAHLRGGLGSSGSTANAARGLAGLESFCHAPRVQRFAA
jgi:hypothetical protein